MKQGAKEATHVSLDLEPVEVDDVGDRSVEEVRVVRDDDAGAVGERREVVERSPGPSKSERE
jgi:hypothetical protein